MADVPVGVFLSGGIDSSAIAATMSDIVREPIKTFSVAFAEREANELNYARAVKRLLKTDHHELVLSPQQFFGALPLLVYQEDEPIAHPSSVPLYFVSELARRHVKVVLTGEGSDELLAGYNKYRMAVYNLRIGRSYQRMVPPAVRKFLKRQIETGNRGSAVGRRLRRTFLCLRADIRDLYFNNFSVYSPSMQDSLFTPETLVRMAGKDPYSACINHMDASGADDLLDQLLASDLKTYLHELLMKQDQMSMAASLESRVPFLDHKLVEFSAALPIGMKLRRWTTKYVLRQAMRNTLPNEILRRRKMGFPVPLENWLRGPFRHILDEYVLSPRTAARGIFNQAYARQLVNRHAAGENHAERLWMLVNFEIWQRRFFDGELQERPARASEMVSSPLRRVV
jgi:asparagine synthase (glutamine-hydrolysing)